MACWALMKRYFRKFPSPQVLKGPDILVTSEVFFNRLQPMFEKELA
jgi:hypothetical protein